MVRFEKGKIVIEVESVSPAEDWVGLMRSLLRIVSITDKESLNSKDDPLYDVCWLLESMVPGSDDAGKMEAE